jgi:hypothetical protein
MEPRHPEVIEELKQGHDAYGSGHGQAGQPAGQNAGQPAGQNAGQPGGHNAHHGQQHQHQQHHS